jgi:methionyl-tRNA formyltransferase
MGSDAFSVPTLELLRQHHDVALVVTQPDKARGRGMKESANPVKAAADRLGVPVAQPTRLKDEGFVETLRQAAPEVIVVVAYGKIIPPVVLNLPKHGCINVHGSVLPEYRGAAPIERAIVNGEKSTGITTFYMNQGLDTGDVILIESSEIGVDETGGEVRERMSHVGAQVLGRTLDLVAAGTAPRLPQDLSAGQATYSPTIKNDECWLDWTQQAERVANTVRAFFPHPGTQTMYRGQVLKLKRMRAVEGHGAPGAVLEVVKNKGLVVACGEGAVLLEEVQPAGKKWMNAWAFAQGYRPTLGEVLGGRPAPVPA